MLQQLKTTQRNIGVGLTAFGLMLGVAGLSVTIAAPATAASNLVQLDNRPDLEGNQHIVATNTQPASGNTTQAQNTANSNPLYNPWLALIPLVLLLAAVWWLIKRNNRPVWEQRNYGQYPFSMAGAKGGESKAYRNDNDVYVEKLRNQERRLREFYDNEPLQKPDE